MCTCEDVLAQSGGATIFAVVEMLRGGGALEVLHGQAVAQDVRLQVGTRPELPINKREEQTRGGGGCLQETLLGNSKRSPSGFARLHNSPRTKHSFSCVYL